MIDIHNHLLYDMDDGAKTIDESLLMLKDAVQQGITNVVLTPHYRKGMFHYDKETIIKKTMHLRACCKEMGIPIRIHLGCEYHVDGKLLDNITSGKVRTMAGGDYILMEFSYYSEFEEIIEHIRTVSNSDYKAVIAHAERYECLAKNPKLCRLLKDEGALIQCNAASILGYDTKAMMKATHKMLKLHVVDVIASDSHGSVNRPNYMMEAEQYISRKYGSEYAEYMFFEAPARIIRRKR